MPLGGGAFQWRRLLRDGFRFRQRFQALEQPLRFPLRQRERVPQVHEGFQERPQLFFRSLLFRLFRDGVACFQSFQGAAELLQRFGVLLLLGARRLRLQVHLMLERHELGHQRGQVHLVGRGRRRRHRHGVLCCQPAAKVAQQPVDGLRFRGS